MSKGWSFLIPSRKKKEKEKAKKAEAAAAAAAAASASTATATVEHHHHHHNRLAAATAASTNHVLGISSPPTISDVKPTIAEIPTLPELSLTELHPDNDQQTETTHVLPELTIAKDPEAAVSAPADDTSSLAVAAEQRPSLAVATTTTTTTTTITSEAAVPEPEISAESPAVIVTPKSEPEHELKQTTTTAAAATTTGPGTESLADDQYLSASVSSIQDQGWTSVTPQNRSSPSSPSPPSSTHQEEELEEPSPTTPTAYDDVVSIPSPSPSPSHEPAEGEEEEEEEEEHKHQQQPPPIYDDISVQADDRTEIEDRDAQILFLQRQRADLKEQLGGLHEELLAAHTKNEELAVSTQTVSALELAVHALEEDQSEARRREEVMKEEFERGRGRVVELEAETRRLTELLAEAEVRSRAAQEELALAAEREQVLEGNGIQLVERQGVLESLVRSLEDDMAQVVSREETLRSELDVARARVRVLESNRGEHVEELEKERDDVVAKSKADHGQWMNDMDALLQKLKVLETDKADLLAGLESAMARNRELESTVSNHGLELQAKDAQIRSVEENYTKMTNQIQAALESAIRQNEEIQAQMRRQGDERRAMEQQLQDLRVAHADLLKQPNQRQLERFERQNRMLIDQIRRQSENVRRIRQTTGSPAGGLNSVDRSLKEDMDVLALVKKLNLEIFQTAAHMADSLNFTGARTLPAHRTRGVVERATLTMGRPMVLALSDLSSRPGEQEFNPLPVQFGLQACLVRCCARIVTSWYPGHWEYGEFLATIYSRIQESGTKVASKWRAVTQAQIKQPVDNELQTTMRGFLQANLVDALIVSGWYDSQSAAQETFSSFRERLAQIVKLALRLNVAVGEEWETIVVFPNDRFEQETMENAYDGEDLEDVQQVVCTTGIGLKSHVGEIVIKPQVILRSTLREETGFDAVE